MPSPKFQIFTYGVPAIAIALLGLPLYVYLPTFYAQDVGLGVFGVGIALFFARIFDMLNDPFIGYLSDTYMRRKRMMLIGAVLLYVTFFALTHPPKESGIFYLLFLSIGVYAAWSLLSIPYYALSSDISNSYHENTHFSSSREFFNILGALLALVLPYYFKVAEDAGASLFVLWDALSIILPLSLLLFFLFLKEGKRRKNSVSLVRVFKHFTLEMMESRSVFLAFFLNNFANAIPATLFLFFISFVVEAKDASGVLLLLYFGSGVLSLPLWIVLSKKISKKTAWLISRGVRVFSSFLCCF